MQKGVFHPAGLSSGLVALLRAVPCPASPAAMSQAPPAAVVATAMPAVLTRGAAGPGKEGAAAVCLGETQKILGWAMGKVKQTIYFQAEWSDVSVSV